MLNRKADVKKDECVACGCCLKVCSQNAITIYKGIYAVVDVGTCVGCRKCEKECPASVISMKEYASNE